MIILQHIVVDLHKFDFPNYNSIETIKEMRGKPYFPQETYPTIIGFYSPLKKEKKLQSYMTH
jgi:hypothetical protein